jgi:hypothetical protein
MSPNFESEHPVFQLPTSSHLDRAVTTFLSLCQAALTIGTETTGSILFPSQANGVVGIKPMVGLVSRQGIVPLSLSQDTAGYPIILFAVLYFLYFLLSAAGEFSFPSWRPLTDVLKKITMICQPLEERTRTGKVV